MNSIVVVVVGGGWICGKLNFVKFNVYYLDSFLVENAGTTPGQLWISLGIFFWLWKTGELSTVHSTTIHRRCG
jgi:hypothetical protein